MSNSPEGKFVTSPSKSTLPDPGFWAGRNVFITGHTGFKGSWLCALLHHLGANVFGYALRPSTEPNIFEQARIEELLSGSTIDDIRNRSALKAALKESKASIAIHLAAQPLVLPAYQDPVETYDINVTGTASFLDAVRAAHEVKAALVITTDKCYDNKEWAWPYREDDQLGGFDPYSNSKACAELVVDSFRRSFFSDASGSQLSRVIGIASARAGNVVGGGDWSPHRIVPDCMRTLLQGEQLTLRNPHAVRPWQHVIEPLVGYLRLCECLFSDPRKFAEGWNFGPDETLVKSVQDLAHGIRDVLDSSSSRFKGAISVAPSNVAKAHEAGVLRLDCSKAKHLLNWLPSLNFDQTIKLTVDWYMHWSSGTDMRSFTQTQISEYLNA